MKALASRPITLQCWIILAFVFTVQVICAQEIDSAIQVAIMPGDSTLTIVSERLPLHGVGIELHNMSSNKKYLILKGQVVRVLTTHKKGMRRIKRTRLVEITNHNLTFKPFNHHYVATTYADSTLRYIAFTTPGSIVRGVLVNTLVLAVVAFEILLVPIAILSGDAQYVSSLGGPPISFDDFQKHIRLFKRGDRRWGVAVLTNSPSKI